MALTRLDPVAPLPVDLEEAKAFLRVEHDDEDVVITSLVTVATAALTSRLGRCLVAQAWRFRVERPSAVISLPLPPVLAITRVAYLDALDAEVAAAAGNYRVTGVGDLEGARIARAGASSWWGSATVVDFTAGLAADPGSVPQPLKTAILMHVAHLFAVRESVAFDRPGHEVPHGYEDLIQPYRVWSF